MDIRILELCRLDSRRFWAALDVRNRAANSISVIASPLLGNRVQTSVGSSSTEKAALKRVEADETLRETAEKLAERQLVVYEAVSNMNDSRERAVIIAYYLDVNTPTLEQIADRWGVSLITLKRLKAKAIESFRAVESLPYLSSRP